MHAARPPVFEDNNIANIFEKNSSKIDEALAGYNQVNQWGWKRPMAINYLDKTDEFLRSPRYIFVFRDILSIANRNEISMGSDLLPLMNSAVSGYAKIISFLEKTNSPCLLCSSEKINRYPENAVEAIAQFIGATPTKEQLHHACASINPEPLEYLKVSRTNRTHGEIESVANNVVTGWAAWWSKDEPAEVEIYLDNVLCKTVLADGKRADLAGKINTRDGCCGFQIEIPGEELHNKTSVRAKIKHDDIDLSGSPVLLE